MTAPRDILTEHTREGILLVTLNRPEVRNALRTGLLRELAAALTAAAADDGVRCVVLTGGPKVFAAGADIRELAAMDTVDTLTDARPGLWHQIARCPKPIVAAVNGYALGGGCELVMHADIVIAAEDARFGQPEINLGIIPGAGGTQRLIRTVGKPLAMKMVLAGEWIDAHTALAAGLVAEVTPGDRTLERALELAATIADKPPVAVREAKQLLLQSYEMPLTAALAAERKVFSLLAATEDRAEGLSAFLEKRKPNFKGR